MHPSIQASTHPCREHSLEFCPFLERRGHSLFQPECAGISRFAAPSLSAHPSAWPHFRAAAPLDQDPKRSGRPGGVVSGRLLSSALRSHACCMGMGGGGHAHPYPPQIPQPSSRSNLAVADPEPREIGGVAPQSLVLPVLSVEGWQQAIGAVFHQDLQDRVQYTQHTVRNTATRCGFCRLRACQPRHTLRKRALAARDRDVPGAACPRGVYRAPALQDRTN